MRLTDCIVPILALLGYATSQVNRRHQPSSAMEETSVLPSEIDVLCGSGNGLSQHLGNIRFRRIVAKHYARHTLAPTKSEKAKIGQAIIHEVLLPGARFLKKDPMFQKWHKAGLKVARVKISHRICEIRLANKAAKGLDVQHLLREKPFVDDKKDRQQISVLVGGETNGVVKEKLQQLSHQLPGLVHTGTSRSTVTTQPQNVMGTESVVSRFSSPSLGSRFFPHQHEGQQLSPPFSILGGSEAQASQEASFDTFSFTMSASRLSALDIQHAIVLQNQERATTRIAGDAPLLLLPQTEWAPNTTPQGPHLIHGTRSVSASTSASFTPDLVSGEHRFNNTSSPQLQQGGESTQADRDEGIYAPLCFEVVEDLHALFVNDELTPLMR